MRYQAKHDAPAPGLYLLTRRVVNPCHDPNAKRWCSTNAAAWDKGTRVVFRSYRGGAPMSFVINAHKFSRRGDAQIWDAIIPELEPAEMDLDAWMVTHRVTYAELADVVRQLIREGVTFDQLTSLYKRSRERIVLPK